METTKKITTLRLTKEETRQLESLIKELGESQSQIFRRALQKLYDSVFKS